jgi:hypothetical protein
VRWHWGLGAAVLSAMVNATVQLSVFYDRWQTFRQYDLSFHEFIRQFTWLGMVVTACFCGLVGALYQQRLDQKAELKEMGEYLEKLRREDRDPK